MHRCAQSRRLTWDDSWPAGGACRRYTRLLCNVAHRVLDQYAEVVGLSPAVDKQLHVLRDRLAEELAVSEQLSALAGCLEPILAASLVGGLAL